MFYPAEQITLPHQPQYLLVVHDQPVSLELFGDPPVAITGKLKADSLDAVDEVRL